MHLHSLAHLKYSWVKSLAPLLLRSYTARERELFLQLSSTTTLFSLHSESDTSILSADLPLLMCIVQ